MRTPSRWIIPLVVAALAAAIALPYRHDITAERERIAAGARIAQTDCGPIQYAEAGAGPPLLVIHGAGGGYDQGMSFVAPLARRGFRIIAVSRFGYLGTPMPADGSAAAQARAHACLLDALGLARAAVFGGSAGAPSAMQFAITYPERTTHLVLLVPAAFVPRPAGGRPLVTPPGTQLLFDTALRSDFLFWAAIRTAPRIVMRAILATPPEVVEAAGAPERARVDRVMREILPVSPRRLGLVNDAAVTSTLPRYELERIASPTLVVSARDDLFGTWEGARYTAEHVPKARFIGYEKGGHLLVGHEEQQLAEIYRFLVGA